MTTLQNKPRTVVTPDTPNECLITNRRPFHDRARAQIDDTIMRQAVAKAQDTIGKNAMNMMAELGDAKGWRDRAAQIRDYVLANLDALLYQLSENVRKNGGHVFFAKTKEDAANYISEVIKKKNAKRIVKSKSMVTEEIGLNHVLQAQGCKVVETDLGEYILQVAGDKPSHVVVPAIHRDRVQIRKALHEKLGYNGPDTPEQITRYVRGVLRPEFMNADVGITGCNFAIAETGSICLVTNEGNGRMVTSLPKTQITVMGMERVAPTFKEAEILITMLARMAVGARLTGYNSWVTPPRKPGESEGPEEFHLVILDNGRSKILGTVFQEILRCIRCGACMNTCPCYREIGGHGYGSIYPGPLGAVLTPLFGGYEKFGELPHVCTLCTACDTVCPVEIPLSQLIMKHRMAQVELGIRPMAERMSMSMFGWLNSHPTLWNRAVKSGHSMANAMIKDGKAPFMPGPVDKWHEARDLPTPDNDGFRQWMQAHQAGKQ